MNAAAGIRPVGKSLRVVASLTFIAGAGGMALSLGFLGSANHFDVIAGAAGFVAGSILAASGLLSMAILSQAPPYLSNTVATHTPRQRFAVPLHINRWITHFQRNRENRPEPNWNAPIAISDKVLRPLLKSLEQFQLGDGGGPACLIARDAKDFRASTERMAELVDLWFAEEKEHARLLHGAVKRFGGKPIRGHWSFSAFCLSRELLGVRFELTVLLLTEIVSTVYYRLLRRHVDDSPLRSMCRLILRDEVGHVAFHRDRLASFARLHKANYGTMWEMRFRALGLAAGTMLYVNHSPALRAAGATTSEFYREVWKELSRFIRRLRCEAQPVVK